MEKLFKHLKIYLLKNDIIRFEYSPNDHFVTQESLFVAHKKVSNEEIDFEGTSFSYKGFDFSFNEDRVAGGVVTDMNTKGFYADDIGLNQRHRSENTERLTALTESPF